MNSSVLVVADDTDGVTSVVIPARNEARGIERAIARIRATLDHCAAEWEIVVIDDGSEDETFQILEELSQRDRRVRGVRLSRNFGKEAALLAGLRHARGRRVITMDADLQHPPELIPDMIRLWRDGAMVVNCVKRSRRSDAWVTRLRASVFNAVMSKLGGIDLHNASDFKLLDRQVVDHLASGLPERERLYRGLTEWVGFRSEDLPFDVETRMDGQGQWSLLRLMELALTALVSFTSAPLRIVTLMGMLTLILGAVIGVDALISWILGNSVSGFATLIITLLMIGSFVMISLGVMGEYIARIYEEVKRRPPYLVAVTTDMHRSGADHDTRAEAGIADKKTPANEG